MTLDGWQELSLSDLATIVGGGTPGRRQSAYWDGDVPWATPTDVTGLSGRIISETISTITNEGLANSSAALLPPCSLLMTTRATIGACAINRVSMATNQGFQSLVPKQSTCVEFLYYLIQHHKRRLERLAAGSTFLEVSKRAIRSFRVAVPPLPEQRKIAAILSSVDDTIEKTQAVIDQVQVVKRGLMQELLTRGLPGRHTRFKQTDIGEIPTDWDIKPVGDVFEVLDRMRKPLNKSQRETMKGLYPYYGANGVVDYVSEWLFDEPLILMAEDGGYFDEFRTRPIAYMIDGKCWVNNHAHVLRTREGFDIRWLFYSLVHMDVRPFINTGTRSKLNQRDLINIPVAAPPVPEQREIAAILSSVDDAIEENQTVMDRLRVVKSGLMSILLTGEIRVTSDPETAYDPGGHRVERAIPRGEPRGRELPQSPGHTCVPPKAAPFFPHGVLLRTAARGTFG